MKFLIQAFNGNSLLHGLLMAFLTASLGSLYTIISNGNLPTIAQWQTIGITTLTATLGYLIKNGLAGSANAIPPVPPVAH
jgi:hypothetical protein